MIKNILFMTALLLPVGLTFAEEQKAVPAVSKASAGVPFIAAGKPVLKGSTANTKVRLVDINSAGPSELKTLPGVSDSVARKIIAARPFGSKTQLTTSGIIPRETYENIKRMVVAKQNPETVAKLLKK